MRASVRFCLDLVAVLAAATPASALDLNSFRRSHHLSPLHQSATLNSAARRHAADLARRDHLDHDGFYQRMDGYSRAAENVAMIACARPNAKPVPTFAGRACGCANADCAYRMWANSAGHRRNMLMGGLTHYGLASATSASGRRYWVLELAGERPAPVLLRAPAHRGHTKKRGAGALVDWRGHPGRMRGAQLAPDLSARSRSGRPLPFLISVNAPRAGSRDH